jgi:hypothetical protein
VSFSHFLGFSGRIGVWLELYMQTPEKLEIVQEMAWEKAGIFSFN